MLERCYSERYKKSNPTYSECSTSSEWLSFMVFRGWMDKQDWQGKELDKDILIPNNKIYSKETCLFVSRQVNQILCASDAARGEWPLGVCKGRPGKFRAAIFKYNKRVHLGTFRSPEDASMVYREAKRLYILEVSSCEKDIRVKQALIRHSERFR